MNNALNSTKEPNRLREAGNRILERYKVYGDTDFGIYLHNLVPNNGVYKRIVDIIVKDLIDEAYFIYEEDNDLLLDYDDAEDEDGFWPEDGDYDNDEDFLEEALSTRNRIDCLKAMFKERSAGIDPRLITSINDISTELTKNKLDQLKKLI